MDFQGKSIWRPSFSMRVPMRFRYRWRLCSNLSAWLSAAHRSSCTRRDWRWLRHEGSRRSSVWRCRRRCLWQIFWDIFFFFFVGLTFNHSKKMQRVQFVTIYILQGLLSMFFGSGLLPNVTDAGFLSSGRFDSLNATDGVMNSNHRKDWTVINLECFLFCKVCTLSI